ncbi:hypothetical protein [Bryobacter aggregatus]|uniref:hypothetical protein n=1 Tax=Bryobacter aggregatus TaxID=360054 RepID=UPI0012BA5FF0|nr:hypothetical protein [Bryobacter aggregatus]
MWSCYFSICSLGARYRLIRYRAALRGSAETGSIVIASRSLGFRDHLLGRLFAGEPHVEELGSVRSWNLRQRLETLSQEADLVFAQTGRFSGRLLFGGRFLSMPAWVGHRSPVPGDRIEEKRQLERVAGAMQTVRKQKLEFTLDYDLASADVFYHEYYRPTMIERHGAHAILMPVRQVKQMVQRGALLWITSENGRIGGAVIQRDGTTLILSAIGTRMGSRRSGAMTACYSYSFAVAREWGCRQVDFRGSRPSLTDGLLQYKRRWGSVLYDSPDVSFDEIALYWSRPSATVHAYLEQYAPIVRDCGRLVGCSIGAQLVPAGLSACLWLESETLPENTEEFLQLLKQRDGNAPEESSH